MIDIVENCVLDSFVVLEKGTRSRLGGGVHNILSQPTWTSIGWWEQFHLRIQYPDKLITAKGGANKRQEDCMLTCCCFAHFLVCFLEVLCLRCLITWRACILDVLCLLGLLWLLELLCFFEERSSWLCQLCTRNCKLPYWSTLWLGKMSNEIFFLHVSAFRFEGNRWIRPIKPHLFLNRSTE